MHCSSLGEFEQGRILIEKLHQDCPEVETVLTFFSPSGYEIRKNYPQADHVLYLPKESPQTAEKWVAELRPDLVIWVKYDFWYFYLRAIHKAQIPLLLVSGLFDEKSPFFKKNALLHQQMIGFFQRLYVQDEASQRRLQSHFPKADVRIGGDNRIDRVAQIAQKPPNNEYISRFLATHPNQKILVGGSVYQAEASLLADYMEKQTDLVLILAPHDIRPKNIRAIAQFFKKVSLYSEQKLQKEAKVMIVDQIGLLSGLYQFADVALVGGGFGKSIHNTLEPAVFGIPVAFGPAAYTKFKEAHDLVEKGGFMLLEQNTADFHQKMDKLFDEREKMGDINKAYIQEKAGKSNTIAADIQNILTKK